MEPLRPRHNGTRVQAAYDTGRSGGYRHGSRFPGGGSRGPGRKTRSRKAAGARSGGSGWPLRPKGWIWMPIWTLWAGERLEDRTQPILVLEDAHPPMSFYRICDGNVRSYWISHEAPTFLDSDKVRRTGNMSYMRGHYQHSAGYRFLRKHFAGSPGNNYVDSDMWGILAGTGLGVGEDRRNLFRPNRVRG